jgi:hypothetical protein
MKSLAVSTNEFAQAYASQKPMTKAEVLKLKPGTWIELKWMDGPNAPALLLEKPENERGDVSLHCYYPERGRHDNHPVHTQVIRVNSPLVVPDL